MSPLVTLTVVHWAAAVAGVLLVGFGAGVRGEWGQGLLPLVVGIFSTSISGGQIMARTGRYKWMPISGAILVGGALFAFSTLQVDTAYLTIAVIMFFSSWVTLRIISPL